VFPSGPEVFTGMGFRIVTLLERKEERKKGKKERKKKGKKERKKKKKKKKKNVGKRIRTSEGEPSRYITYIPSTKLLIGCSSLPP
jgi:transposase